MKSGCFRLVGQPALNELLKSEIAVNPAVSTEWFGVIMAVFLVGAATGGVLFGWLGDRIGRVRAMSLSILTYAIFTGLCGFAVAAWQIAALRFVASLGMGGEWALGVAIVTELWPDRSRAVLAGLIGAAANVGMLLVGLLSLVLVSFLQGIGAFLLSAGMQEATVEALLRGDGWRLLMIAGALPALLVFFIRLFVPGVAQMGGGARFRRNESLGHARFVGRADRCHQRTGGDRDLVAHLWQLGARSFGQR